MAGQLGSLPARVRYLIRDFLHPLETAWLQHVVDLDAFKEEEVILLGVNEPSYFYPEREQIRWLVIHINTVYSMTEVVRNSEVGYYDSHTLPVKWRRGCFFVPRHQSQEEVCIISHDQTSLLPGYQVTTFKNTKNLIFSKGVPISDWKVFVKDCFTLRLEIRRVSEIAFIWIKLRRQGDMVYVSDATETTTHLVDPEELEKLVVSLKGEGAKARVVFNF